MRRIASWLAAAGLYVVAGLPGWGAEKAALELEAKIPLGNVEGRIDQLAIDVVRRRLFVAEPGNGSFGIVDIGKRKTLQTITGLVEPQGVGYVPRTDTIYVAGADGSLTLFQGLDPILTGRIKLGSNADRVFVDAATDRVYIGYGSGALAVVSAARRRRVMDIPLKAHPEGFQFDPSSRRILVNVPEAREMSVIDSASGKQIDAWPIHGARGNDAMAMDMRGRRVFVATRDPAKLLVLSTTDGATLASLDSCGDAGDVSFDERRQRAYVSCGAGFIDVFSVEKSLYAHVSRLPTATGARTSLFVFALDRLFLAARADANAPAAIWIYRPSP